MKYLISSHTDIGIKKKTNQDSVLIEIAETDRGEVCLAAVCDGMGGLSKGEVASASLIAALKNWYRQAFPEMIQGQFGLDDLIKSWGSLLNTMNVKITNYGIDNKVRLGTTVAVLLIVDGNYYAVTVGDSRVYLLTDTVAQLTKDQTFIQREMDAGRMTYEEAMSSPERNVLLQCIGASDAIMPEFVSGDALPNTTFLICSDGFRHMISNEEILGSLGPRAAVDEQSMQSAMVRLTELNKSRNEEDNISAAAIRVCA